MTEAEWLTGDATREMFDLVRGRASERKLRLIVCELIRRDPDAARVENARESVELAERWADGTITDNEIIAFNQATLNVATGEEWMTLSVDIADSLKLAIRADLPERVVQGALLLREAFGNPFRPATFDPAWRTSDVLALARGIYAERAFDRMPILADALQDAGCNNDDILAHCRDTSLAHVRGCWVVDLVLGKE